MEGPFAVELDDGERRGGGLALGGDEALAGVVALGGAGPEEEAAVEGWRGLVEGGEGWGGGERTDGGLVLRVGAAIFAFADLVVGERC